MQLILTLLEKKPHGSLQPGTLLDLKLRGMRQGTTSGLGSIVFSLLGHQGNTAPLSGGSVQRSWRSPPSTPNPASFFVRTTRRKNHTCVKRAALVSLPCFLFRLAVSIWVNAASWMSCNLRSYKAWQHRWRFPAREPKGVAWI